MTLKDAAISYAKRGWHVVPLFAIDIDGTCECKRPVGESCSPGKHPRTRNGLSDATADPIKILEWWDLWPTANIGVIAGASGFVVLDVDPRNGGLESAKELVKEFGSLPETWMAATGGGGVHYIFKHPGIRVGNRKDIRPGIDRKGDGGYFVAAPSNHLSGKTYQWINDPDSCPLAPCPKWFLKDEREYEESVAGPLQPLEDRVRRASKYLSAIPPAISGQGGHQTTWGAALSLVKGFALPSEEAFKLLSVEYNAKCNPPWSEKELRHKIEDALKSSAPEGYIINKTRGNGHAVEMKSPAETLADPMDVPRTLTELRAEAKILEAIPKTDLGIKEIDNHINGIRAGWTTVLGAFSGGGKTTFVTFLGISLASRSHPVLILTNELSEYEVTNRIDICLDVPSDLPSLKIWSPQGDIYRVVSGIERWLSEWEGSERTPIVLADYLQKFRPDSKEKARERQVAMMAEAFQSLGRKHQYINILAAQLNRESQKEEKPKLHHLRESGLIEQVADVAILLSKPADDQAEFEIAKHRWGKSGGSATLSVDWARARYGILSPTQMWASLGKLIRQFILESGQQSVKLRDLQQKLSSHPKKDEVIKASQATGWFSVVNSDVFLRPTTDAV